MRLLLFLSCCKFFLPFTLMGQIPVEKGFSESHRGMFYYDVKEADDRRPRRYVYTVCPEDASCISLDFRLLHSMKEVDFIRIYDGKDPQSPVLGTLGAKSGDLLLQSDGGCLTFEFLRDAEGLNTVWTANWQSDLEGDCIDSRTGQNECPDVTEVCGPRFHQPLVLPLQDAPDTPLSFACLPPLQNPSWYKFKARKDGELQFRLKPDNGVEDLDWALWGGDQLPPEACPDKVLEMGKLLACNAALGKGPGGSTGMEPKGKASQIKSGGSPFCAPLPVKQGEVFYLLVDGNAKPTSGFNIEFNEVVLQCGGPVGAFVQFAHKPVRVKSKILPKDQFSRYTKVLRVSLDEKANAPLAECNLEPNLFRSGKSPKTAARPLPGSEGLPLALINYLRCTGNRALEARNFASPVHYGDLLEMAWRFAPDPPDWEAEVDTVFGAPDLAYWNPEPDLFLNFCHAFELIVDEVFDRRRGAVKREIRYIRLLWSDWEGDLPDYNVCVFPWPEIEGWLDQIKVPSAHNDLQGQSLRDLLEGGLYHGFPIRLRGKDFRTAPEGHNEELRALEYQNYNWDF